MADLPSSSFSRYHPAILASIGFAAAFGVYTIYTAVAFQPAEPALRRSNAVHRPRRDRPHVGHNAVLRNDATRSNPSIPDEETVDAAETERLDSIEAAGDREPNQGLRGLLYYIAEEASKRRAYEHHGISCEECGEYPIRGVRWHCLNCPDFDLCSTCEASSVHTQTHVFAKIKIPIPFLSQPTKEYKLWYPGDPRKIHPTLDAKLRKRLAEFHGFEEPRVDALYDQFTCIANMPWPSDPSHVHAAIDKRAFDRALRSERWPERFAPNAMFDRMFAFYDTNQDGLIGFEELVNGMAYLTGPNRFASLHRSIRGYDIDGNGFVGRKDFLRLLRAKFAIQKQLVHDMIESHEREQTQAAMEILRSSQPISSIFSEEEIPPGIVRLPRGKRINNHGDLLPEDGTKTILDEADPWLDDQTVSPEPHSHQTMMLSPHMAPSSPTSRFEELLFEPTDERDGTASFRDSNTESHVSAAGPHDRRDATSAGSNIQQLRELAEHESLSQDVLWEIAEASINERLDPLFKAKEQKDMHVKNTASARAQWRKEIDALAESKKDLLKILTEGMEDPLMATAKHSLEDPPTAFESILGSELGPPGEMDMQRTDSESLARRETEIAEQPLEELLHNAGYSIRDRNDQDDTAQRPQAAHMGLSPIWNGVRSNSATSPLARIVSNGAVLDPTLPQNRPDRAQIVEHPANDASKSTDALPVTKSRTFSQRPPPRKLLEEYALLDEQEREIADRGGPGRLTYNEIEALAVADPTKELRSLIRSWLEWAIF